MANHTPGPWVISALDMRTIGHFTENTDPQFKEVDRFQAVALVRDRIGATEANARLIAAAPDLLKACKWLPIEKSFEDAADFKDNALRFLKAMELARAAIAKAEGRDQ